MCIYIYTHIYVCSYDCCCVLMVIADVINSVSLLSHTQAHQIGSSCGA